MVTLKSIIYYGLCNGNKNLKKSYTWKCIVMDICCKYIIPKSSEEINFFPKMTFIFFLKFSEFLFHITVSSNLKTNNTHFDFQGV